MILYDINNKKIEVNPKLVMYTKEVDRQYTMYAFVDGSTIELKRQKDEWSNIEIKPIKMEDIKYK